MTSRPSIGRIRIGLLNTMFSASNSLTWAAVGLPDSRSLRKGCIVIPPMVRCGERRRTTATGSWKAEEQLKHGPRLRLGFCCRADLVVPGFDGFQGLCKPL